MHAKRPLRTSFINAKRSCRIHQTETETVQSVAPNRSLALIQVKAELPVAKEQREPAQCYRLPEFELALLALRC